MILNPLAGLSQISHRRGVSGGPPPGDVEFITSSPSGTTRNDIGSYVGFRMVIGAADIVVTELGRWVLSGNSEVHTITMYDATPTALESVNLDTSGLSVGYNYVALASPLTLLAGTEYRLGTLENSGGDLWYDTQAFTTTADGTITFSAFLTGLVATVAAGSNSFGPPSFKYHL